MDWSFVDVERANELIAKRDTTIPILYFFFLSSRIISTRLNFVSMSRYVH